MTSLQIRDLAVLHEIDIGLAGGFSALTGETGAGKSMLVDALSLVLGARADSGIVRQDAPRAEVTATFDLCDRPDVVAWLARHDLDAGEDCQLRRVLTPEGRSRAYINGRAATAEMLRSLGEQLVEICGQHAYQSLLRPAMQRELLDAFGGHDDLVSAVAAAHQQWTLATAEHERLLRDTTERDSRLELLRYQIGELSALNPAEGEYEDLARERLLLANVGRISSGLHTVLERIYETEGFCAHDSIGAAQRELDSLLTLDPELQAAHATLDLAQIHVVETAETIRRRLSGLEHDPARQDFIESRLDSFETLARRHRCEPGALWQCVPLLRTELQALDESASRQRQGEAALTRLSEALRKAAATLTAARLDVAQSLSEAVTAGLRELGMPDAVFSVEVTTAADDTIAAHGQDRIEFLVSANAGQPPGAIARVASGGELSRLSLALEVAAMTDRAASTLIFDEVDAGIGGGVAEIVGQQLRHLSRQRQVLCVTHLPQVASQAEHHFNVTKNTIDSATRAVVLQLSPAARVEEIARMLGGVKITARTRAHAREMLQLAGGVLRAG
ncbi:MAG: DNA repair protein RecN [Gammaproteobacteria bacterium]|nr:DNA repair protein RecN [Gammaproteobacteria bacterium]